MDLVNAQQARRALDYLVGFNLSPLLWKKVRQGLSAGRVQSPALRMICERDEAIDAFVPQEYWTIDAEGEAQRSRLPAEAHRVRRQEGGAVQLHEREAARARSRPTLNKAPRRPAHRRHHRPQAAPPQPGAAVHHFHAAAGSRAQARASPRSARCAWRSSCTRAWISAKAPSASSPTCVPTR